MLQSGAAPPAIVRPARRVRGRLRPPGDKSISHRYALLAALALGRSRLEHFAPGADCAATLACLDALGVAIARFGNDVVEIEGRGLGGLSAPGATLDARNSGTTMRLLTGVLSAHPFTSAIAGDASLSRRPMRRIAEPLTRMGATIETSEGGRPPIVVRGGRLTGIDVALDVPSAQVKSAIMLAGLHADGRTTVREPACTRDHTERALQAFGAQVDIDGQAIALDGGQQLSAGSRRIAGDVSSAAFVGVAAAGLPGSRIEIEDVGLNPTRTAWLNVLRRAGAAVDVVVERDESGEPVGRITIAHARVDPVVIAPAEVPLLIDELPALAALGAFGGAVEVTGAGELRHKESDRITALVGGLRALGFDAEERGDGFVVRPSRPRGGEADAAGDHRLAMTLTVAALAAGEESRISGADSVAISYPGFFDVLRAVCA
jgi:3-phosphoshikimate 1-carboxyvinyltransferase